MLIRVMGYVDETVIVDSDEYAKAKQEKRLEKLMEPIINELDVELMWAPAKDFS